MGAAVRPLGPHCLGPPEQALEQDLQQLLIALAPAGQDAADVHGKILEWLHLTFVDDSLATRFLLEWWWGRMPFASDDPLHPLLSALIAELDPGCTFQRWQALQASLADVPDEPTFPKLSRRQAQGYVDRCRPLPEGYVGLGLWEDHRRRLRLQAGEPVPPCLALHHRLVIHLFSGRRRFGGFQQFAELMLCNTTGYTVLSIDTAVSASMNVFDPKIWSFLVAAATEGHIYALLLGPPCESWSEVRYMQLLDERGFVRRGPRPLRSFAALWGLLGRSLRELSQLNLGNRLLLQGLWLATLVCGRGGRVLVEHPSEPSDPTRPSIWRSAVVQHSCASGLFRKTEVMQYQYGAVGVKPTTLLCGNIDIAALHSWARKDLLKPARALVGVDDQGRFRTFGAKEYPLALNAAFAYCMLRNAGYACSDAAPPDWLELVTESATASANSRGGLILADCQH